MVNSVFTLRSRNTRSDVPKSTLVSGNAPRRIIHTFDSTMENGFDTNNVNTVSIPFDPHKRIVYLTVVVRTSIPVSLISYATLTAQVIIPSLPHIHKFYYLERTCGEGPRTPGDSVFILHISTGQRLQWQ